MRSLVSFLLVPLGVYAGLCALLFLAQRSQIYFPVRESSPAGAASIRFGGSGVDLKIWVVSRPGPQALLYFGGNAEDVAANLGSFATAFPEYSLYLVNYRGYGGSAGSPSESGLVADAIALYDHLRPRHPEISVIGRSLGSGVAVQLASAREVRRLVLVTPFDSLVNVARAHFPFLPVGLLLRDRYESASRISGVDAITLIVIAGSDEIIPRARSDALVAAFPAAQARVFVLEGAMHNDIDLRPQYHEQLRLFLTR
ncbi:MAG: alpha/beta hydrolase [Steroidobacteraceae bacterium]